MKTYGTLLICLLLSACGGGGSSSPDAGTSITSSTGPKPTAEELRTSSHVSCKTSPLKGQWRVYDYGKDLITIDENCVFQSYYCQSIGYIDSDVSKDLGIADVVIVWEGATGNPGCHGTGKLSCAYDARNAYFQELHLNCQ